MKSDGELRSDGLNILLKGLGLVDAERFIALIHRETFDYTEWRKNQWVDSDVATLAAQAREARSSRK